MMTKDQLFAELRLRLSNGEIAPEELAALIPAVTTASVPQSMPVSPAVPRAGDSPTAKLSAVEIMFYIAGIVFFAAVMSLLSQTWSAGGPAVHILLSVGVGSLLWAVAWWLLKRDQHSDMIDGLIGSTLLTGSLSMIVGAGIIAAELSGEQNEPSYYLVALMILLAGLAHIGYDKLVKRNVILLFGVLLCTAAYPLLMAAILRTADVSVDVWSIIFVSAAGLLIGLTRLVQLLNPDREGVGIAFDSFGAFLALAAMYASVYGDYGWLWLIVLVVAVFTLFYLAIIGRSKPLLGSASFFLVLTVITVSFKYFSGYGATTSLVLAALGLLGSAAVAASIRRKYF